MPAPSWGVATSAAKGSRGAVRRFGSRRVRSSTVGRPSPPLGAAAAGVLRVPITGALAVATAVGASIAARSGRSGVVTAGAFVVATAGVWVVAPALAPTVALAGMLAVPLGRAPLVTPAGA